MSYWYKDRDFPEIKTTVESGYVDILAVVEDEDQLNRLISEHNKLVDELRDCKQLKEANHTALKKTEAELEEALKNEQSSAAAYADLKLVSSFPQSRVESELRKQLAEAQRERERQHNLKDACEIDLQSAHDQLQSQAAQLAGMRQVLAGVSRYLISWGDEALEEHEPERQAYDSITKALFTPASDYEKRVQELVDALQIALPSLLDDAYVGAAEALAAWEGKNK